MRKGLLALLLVALVWGFPNVLIKVLSQHFDPLTQSFYRYLAAGSFVLGFTAWLAPDQLRTARGNLRVLLLPVVLLSAHQICYVIGVYQTPAVFAALMSKVSAMLIPALAALAYVEERRLVRQPKFMTGAALALVGVAGIILGKERGDGNLNGFGVFMLGLAMVTWSVYAVMVKRMVRDVSPFALSALMPLLSCLVFLPFLWGFGHWHRPFEVPLPTVLLLLGSGVLVIGIGNTCYYYAVQQVGPSIAAIVLLTTPFTTALFAYAVGQREHLTLAQWLFGLVLLSGCYLISRMEPPKVGAGPPCQPSALGINPPKRKL
jgi:drug/metabolite transporter (DMT)-like permease